MQDPLANSSQRVRMDAAARADGAGSGRLGWGKGMGLPTRPAWLLSCCAVEHRALNAAAFHRPPYGKHTAGQPV